MKNNKFINIESIQIGLASPEKIREWSERILPNGEKVGQVISHETVDHKNLKPKKGGLFCERIFGPIKDFECACLKRKHISGQKICRMTFINNILNSNDPWIQKYFFIDDY